MIDVKIENVLLIRDSIPREEYERFDHIIEQILRYETDTAKRNLTLEMNFLAKRNVINMNGLLNTFEDVAHMSDRIARYANQTAQHNPIGNTDPRVFAHQLEHELLFGNEPPFATVPTSVHVLLRPFVDTNSRRSPMAEKDKLRSVHDAFTTILSLPGSHACSKYRIITSEDTTQINATMIHYDNVEHRASLAMQRLNSLMTNNSYSSIFDPNKITMTGSIDESPSMVTAIAQRCVESLLKMEVDEYGKPES